ncbi:phage tail assembly chaperone [Ponticoccus sp. SC2-23]|uniref:rcc01693 family protein n=1 Tax=Alexandriicola marinus TaxID=2081710 RepID=UPI000FDC5B8C|nr:rcc01693 family protein [Alexandriicola marinus]MBM1222565.1 phage tail assembly chaperone [Ponticoccus sp. SC6-9]MBM1227070.1 phage tail assembly chaperone [Ponticoccus sp. SC6-15]MBM1231491.1 phage tail assembly chaperone [Ponticoccus sp. SC6-38]MBM1236073.1 phage tail assembly chaperone [Ponticoccus sp. SC6-45]MBM1240514.1 phage tail assembly chaperone [Ponticoccus sp. SC6-49]MBM1245049.1 phage tail assembly chaperone [Ponticoccus sp. SC2-64]MBM1249547.1 phage tail assembly chaperone [
MTDRGFDWAAMMRIGLHQLRLKPAEFWALTPLEFLVLLGLEGGPPPMARARLEELSRAYPDGRTDLTEGDGG